MVNARRFLLNSIIIIFNIIIFIFSCDALSEEFYSAPFEDLKVPGQPEIVFNCVDAASELLF